MTMTSTAALPALAVPASLTPNTRSGALDKLRGAAVVVMVLDHLLIVSGHEHSQLRYTITRAAMPLFAVLAGHLVRRFSWRWGAVFLVGGFLPALVPWIDNPNILCLLAFGAAYVAACRRWFPLGLWLLPLVALTMFANGFGMVYADGGYQPQAVMALMCAGALTARDKLDSLGRPLPPFLRAVGRYPLSLYVGHLLALQAFVALNA